MQNKSILMIGNYLSTDKWNKNVWHYLAEKLAVSRWDVITTSSTENQFLRLLDMLKTIWQQRNIYALAQIDVFSGKAFIYAEACSWLLTHLNKPIVLTLHGGGLPGFSQRFPKRVKRILSCAQAVITPSPFIQSALLSICPDIHLIPNPINISKAILRLRENPSPKLIWVRAFHEVYNPSLAPRVIKVLQPEFPDIHLMMLGPDKGDGSLETMLGEAKKLAVDDKIEIVGKVPHQDIPLRLDRADIFINTTNYDNAPSSLMEAMANGLCIVSTNVGGLPYMIEDGHDGLLVPPNDPDAMADAIKRLLTNPGLAGKLSTNARKKAENYDWSVILPQWEAILSRVLDQSNPSK